MLNGSTILKGSATTYATIDGYAPGTATIAELVGAGEAAGLRVGFIRMEDVTIPRGERGEEALYVVSGSVRVEENGATHTAVAGDVIFLAQGAAPTYHWSEDTVIFYALTPSRS